MEPHEVEAGLVDGDSPLLPELAFFVMDREIDPREPGMEPSAPDDVRDVEDAPILEQGSPVSHARHPGDALDAPRLVRLSTRIPLRTGSSKRAAYDSR